MKSKRAIVAPNFNFLGQLLEFDQHLKNRLKNLHKVHTAPATSGPLEFSWELPPQAPPSSSNRKHPRAGEGAELPPLLDKPRPQQQGKGKDAPLLIAKIPPHHRHKHRLHIASSPPGRPSPSSSCSTSPSSATPTLSSSAAEPFFLKSPTRLIKSPNFGC